MSQRIVLERLPVFSSQHSADFDKTVKKRIYIFPTSEGLTFLLMLTVMLLGSVNYNNSMSYILTFLLSSVYMISMLHTYRNLRGLIISTQAVKPVFADDEAELPLLIDNRDEVQRCALEFRARPTKKDQRELVIQGLTVDTEGQTLKRSRIAIKTAKRGIHKTGRLQITSIWPLGLFRAWSYLETSQPCTVYPRPLGNKVLPFLNEYDAEEKLGLYSGTDDFVGHKNYRPGDSISNIDWKVFAREQGLLIKRFTGGGTRKLILRWDHCKNLLNTEDRLSQLCLWVIEAEKQDVYYGLDIPGQDISPGHGRQHQHECLKSLAEYGFTKSET